MQGSNMQKSVILDIVQNVVNWYQLDSAVSEHNFGAPKIQKYFGTQKCFIFIQYCDRNTYSSSPLGARKGDNNHSNEKV